MNATATLNSLEIQHAEKLTADATERLATIALVADIIGGNSPKRKAGADTAWIVPKPGDFVRHLTTKEQDRVAYLTTGSSAETGQTEFAVGTASGKLWRLCEIEPVI